MRSRPFMNNPSPHKKSSRTNGLGGRWNFLKGHPAVGTLDLFSIKDTAVNDYQRLMVLLGIVSLYSSDIKIKKGGAGALGAGKNNLEMDL